MSNAKDISQVINNLDTLIDSADDSNLFTDADHTKLDGVEANSTADQTAAEIKTAYESNSDTNAFTDADHTKLDGVEANADVTPSWVPSSDPSYLTSYTVTEGDVTAHEAALDIATSQLTGNIDLTSQVTGLLPISNMSATALTTVQTAANETAHLALTTQEGDVVVRSDENKTYMHNGGSAGTMADFTLLATPTDSVTSVDGNTGAVTTLQLGTTSTTALAGDTSLFSGSYTDLTNKPTLLTLGTTSTTALAGDTSLFSGAYADLTGKPTIPTNNNQLTNGAGFITSADGGNAATLDGIDSTSFLRSDAADTFTETITGDTLHLGDAQIMSSSAKLQVNGFMRTGSIYLHAGATPTSDNFGLETTTAGVLKWDSNKVWHAGNDGSGSGLDADTVDGVHESTFMRRTANSGLNMDNNNITNVNHLTFNDSGVNEGLQWLGGSDWRIFESPDNLTNAAGNLQFTTGGTRRMTLSTGGSAWTSSQGTLWGSSNDGSGSGLDADNLDGRTWSATRNSANTLVTRDANGYAQLGWINTTSGATTSTINKIYASNDDYMRYVTPATLISQLGLWTSGNDGSGSGLDADTVDGVQASSFLRSDTADTASGKITMSTGIARSAHNNGHLEGSYNNVGSNDYRSNPIYTIGSSYNPASTTLGNMYGIGYSHTNASFIGFAGSSGWGMYVASDGDARVYLSGETGEGYFTGNITAYASDERLKTNVTTIDNALDKVCQLRGVEYDWVDNITSEYDFHPSSMHETGVIAQNVQKVIPDAVCEAPMNANYTAKSGKDHEFLTVDKEKIIPVLIEAIKELKEEVNDLKTQLAEKG